MAHSYCNLFYHIIFSTKHREPWLKEDICERVHNYVGGIIKEEKGVPLIINSGVEHLHILMKLHQESSISTVVRVLKSKSSGWIHRTFPNYAAFGWQTGFAAFTVSISQLEKTRLYILNQEEHHRKRTFQEEYEALLLAHQIEFEQKHLWD
jgi:REP element-mobilizing transposase RayT